MDATIISGNKTNHDAQFPDFVSNRLLTKRRHSVVFLFTVAFIIVYSFCLIKIPSATQHAHLPLSVWLDDNNNPSSSSTTTSTTLSKTATSDATTTNNVASSHHQLTAPSIRGTQITYSIPLPLPREKVSVVLMNYSRPRMIRESTMMRTLLSHPNIDEVLLLHANPKTVFEFVHPKVKNIDAMEHNNEMGLSLRFYFCQIASNNWVLHLDDDMEFTTEALNELIIEYGRNPKRIIGRFGRDLSIGNSFNGYSSTNRHKNTEVILTKLMLMERETCSAFFEYAHLVWNDVVLHNGEGPLWNGEDIFMSLVANHVYQQQQQRQPKDGIQLQFNNNYAMDWLDVWQADDSLKDYDNGRYDISGGMQGIRFWSWRWWQTLLRRNRHYSYRGKLWQIARDRLASLQ
ncbi:MAG: hypothetical protein ACI8RD_008027 [Bacillariaceae sp.]|jgi:hypothetical protein